MVVTLHATIVGIFIARTVTRLRNGPLTNATTVARRIVQTVAKYSTVKFAIYSHALIVERREVVTNVPALSALIALMSAFFARKERASGARKIARVRSSFVVVRAATRFVPIAVT